MYEHGIDMDNKTKTAKLSDLLSTTKTLRLFAALSALIALVMTAFSVYSSVTAEKSKTNGAMMVQKVIKGMKLNTITYQYTDSIFLSEPEEWKLFGLIDIAPGVRYLVVQYDGVINLGIDLGIDASNIRVSELGVDDSGKTILKIIFPEAVEISHEQFRNNEITVLQDGKYTKKEVSRAKLNEAYEKRKAYYSESARSLGLYEQARVSAMSQIDYFLNMIPDFRENYIIQWDI